MTGRGASGEQLTPSGEASTLGRSIEDVQSVLDSTTELLHSVLDSTADGILVVDLSGRIVTYNRRFADMWLLPEHVLATRDDERALQAALQLLADPASFLARVQQLYRDPEAESFDVLELRDGRTFERYTKPRRLRALVCGRVWSFRDVTLHRQAEEKLRLSERYFRSLTENARDLVAIVGEDGCIRYASPSHETVLGYPPEELIGTQAQRWIHPDDLARAAELFLQAVPAPGVMPALEFRFRHRDGSWRTLESVGTNLRDQPNVAGIVVNSRDVSERKRAEARTQTLLAVAGDISATVELGPMLERVQRRAAEALPADVIAVFFDDPTLGKMHVIAQHGLPAEFATLVEALEFEHAELPLTERTARGETITFADLDIRAWLPPALHERLGTSSLIVAPFNAWTRHFGILVAANLSAGRPFDPGQAELCTGIARQVALAIEAGELYRTQREEAEVAGALARVGRDLISNVHQPDFLDRLCQTTAEVLHCNVSSTLLKRPDECVFVAIAGYGFSPEEEELARVMKVPLDLMAGLLERLERDDIAEVGNIPEHVLSTEQQQRHRIAAALCMALRSGTEIVGVQVAHQRDGRSFNPTELRIARGVAQSASLALAHANLVEELERANRVRSEFVATVSHELRTPLNIILGYGDLLLTDTFGALNDEQRSTLQRMDRRARELLDLVNSTLEASRLERGQVPIDVQPISLRELLDAVDAETHELQERAAIPLHREVPSGDVELRTDPAKLKVVLKNLVVNALKFTERGTVTVRVKRAHDGVMIEVTDTGIGIPRDALAIVFQAFRQAHGATAQAHGGVGLGLFIVARFVELLRGTVAVESEVGRGSTFRVSLPYDVLQRPAPVTTATPLE